MDRASVAQFPVQPPALLPVWVTTAFNPSALKQAPYTRSSSRNRYATMDLLIGSFACYDF